jgi:hypothetical protein
MGFGALGELREGMERFAADFDPALITATVAARILEDATAIEAMAATVKGLAAARVADTDVWRRAGYRSPAEHLARKTGTGVGAAIETLPHR